VSATHAYAAKCGRPNSSGWSKLVTKSKTIAAALAVLTHATVITATSGEAQARTRAGIVSAHMADHGYDECRFVDRIDSRGNIRTIKICEVVPY
jgi:hypothetical protein